MSDESDGYGSFPLDFFIGKDVQLAFPINKTWAKFVKANYERMWVYVTGLAETPEQELRGYINNEPQFAIEWSADTVIEFKRSEVIKVDSIDLLPQPYLDNPDERYRETERRAKTGDVHAMSRDLQNRLRKGELELWRVECLANLGYQPAYLLLNKEKDIAETHTSYWRKINRCGAAANPILHTELQFRVIFAAFRSVFSISTPGIFRHDVHVVGGTSSLIRNYITIVSNLEKAFLDFIYNPNWPETEAQNFVDQHYLSWDLHGALNLSGILGGALLDLLVSFENVFQDVEVILPHNQPRIRLGEALQKLDFYFPAGLGGLWDRVTEEITPWLLKDFDPLIARHSNA